MDPARIRNVGVIGPPGVGKTALIEALLAVMGAAHARGGSAREKTGVGPRRSDHHLGLQDGHGTWRGTAINLIDAPGPGGEGSEARLALAAADAVLVVVSTSRGVDSPVRQAYEAARATGLPVMIFVNARDARGARLCPALIETLRAELAADVPTPILCGSAAGNRGLRALLDAIVARMPSPLERAYAELTDVATGACQALVPHAGLPLVATIFKTVADPNLGQICLFRVLRGTIEADTHVAAAGHGGTERVARVYQLLGHEAVPVARLGPGEIGAIAQLKAARTGDTLVAGGPHPRPWAWVPPPAA